MDKLLLLLFKFIGFAILLFALPSAVISSAKNSQKIEDLIKLWHRVQSLCFDKTSNMTKALAQSSHSPNTDQLQLFRMANYRIEAKYEVFTIIHTQKFHTWDWDTL